ncbi:MAG: hypothetical protein JSU96_14695 [Acidobacteriota bacterium]|nr:MAG: hypothetical protein JSU96_14695 [Acidobacteriota bacterium]
MTWFEKLTGFAEESPEQVRTRMTVDGDRMMSAANGRKMVCGRLETPSLGELRVLAQAVPTTPGKLDLAEVVGDVQQLHQQPENEGALFQVASQFNLLEMVSPAVTPEAGIGRYEGDRTQGPACAIACGAGTIYRNYFAPVHGQSGQSEGNQIDCLFDLGTELGNSNQRLWKMSNGYALASASGLQIISERLSSASELERDRLREKVRIGIQWGTEVTLDDSGRCVTQAYCSALPVAYSRLPAELWDRFAQLVLEAAYEATLCVAVLNLSKYGSHKVFLTLLGGGAFGNSAGWIIAALERALRRFDKVPLEVVIVSYGHSNPRIRELISRWSSRL